MIKGILALSLLLTSATAGAQTSPIEPRPLPPKPMTISSAPPAPAPAIDGSVLRMGLIKACTQAIEGSALRNSGYLRGKEVVPEEATRYREEVAGFVAFACPCVVESLDRQFGLKSPTPETMEKVRVAIGPAMQQTCSKDAYVAKLKQAPGS